MHKTGWYLDFRLLFTPSLKHEIPNLVFNLVSLEKKFGAIVSWVLNNRLPGCHTAGTSCSASDSHVRNALDPRRCSIGLSTDIATPDDPFLHRRDTSAADTPKLGVRRQRHRYDTLCFAHTPSTSRHQLHTKQAPLR